MLIALALINCIEAFCTWVKPWVLGVSTICIIVGWANGFSFTHHLPIKTVGRKTLPTLHSYILRIGDSHSNYYTVLMSTRVVCSIVCEAQHTERDNMYAQSVIFTYFISSRAAQASCLSN